MQPIVSKGPTQPLQISSTGSQAERPALQSYGNFPVILDYPPSFESGWWIESENETLSNDDGIVAWLRSGLIRLVREFNDVRIPGCWIATLVVAHDEMNLP